MEYVDKFNERDEWWEFVILDEEPAPGPLTGREMRSPIPPVSVPRRTNPVLHTAAVTFSHVTRQVTFAFNLAPRSSAFSLLFGIAGQYLYRISASTLCWVSFGIFIKFFTFMNKFPSGFYMILNYHIKLIKILKIKLLFFFSTINYPKVENNYALLWIN